MAYGSAQTDPLLTFAPMEGLTTFLYRNLHHEMFGGVDKYYTPFLAPLKQNKKKGYAFKKRDLKDILPENNPGLPLVPQVLCNKPEQFLFAVETFFDLGYQEINLNLGCPMPTVVSKGKGAGFLNDPDELDAFFFAVFNTLAQKGFTVTDDDKAVCGNRLLVSVKTRIGLHGEYEAEALMDVFHRYPIAELIIHARLRDDYYKGAPRTDAFVKMLSASSSPIGYNGDIRSVQDYHALTERLNASAASTTLSSVMMGRGLIADPSLARQLRGGASLSAEELRAFMERLYDEIARIIPEENNILHRMKGIWYYTGVHFADSERQLLELKKARKKIEYDNAVRALFRDCDQNLQSA